MNYSQRVWIARSIAIAADVLQIAVFPVFSEGILSPLNAAVDVLVAVVLIALLGWHIAFLPTFIIEQLPFADLAPTWTVATLIVTRKKAVVSDVEPRLIGEEPGHTGRR